MKRPAWFCVLFCVFATVLSAAPREHDLGKGLVYVRVAETTAGLTAAPNGKSVVLDLRYATTAAVEPGALRDWLQQHAGKTAPVFILANADTAHALRQTVHELAPTTRLLVIGPAAADFQPDIAIPISAEAERRAYDALTADADIAKLLAAAPDKPRYDEAAIMEARNRGGYLDEESEPELIDSTPPAADAPPVDLALQRAVHLHRAWLVLGRTQP